MKKRAPLNKSLSHNSRSASALTLSCFRSSVGSGDFAGPVIRSCREVETELSPPLLPRLSLPFSLEQDRLFFGDSLSLLFSKGDVLLFLEWSLSVFATRNKRLLKMRQRNADFFRYLKDGKWVCQVQ